jgi:hypothetical protein
MTLKIIKLAVSSETKITASPTVSKFFYVTPERIPESATYKIDASDFIDDTGYRWFTSSP